MSALYVVPFFFVTGALLIGFLPTLSERPWSSPAANSLTAAGMLVVLALPKGPEGMFEWALAALTVLALALSLFRLLSAVRRPGMVKP